MNIQSKLHWYLQDMNQIAHKSHCEKAVDVRQFILFFQISMNIIISLKLFLFDRFDIIHRTIEMPAKGQKISQILHKSKNIYRKLPSLYEQNVSGSYLQPNHPEFGISFCSELTTLLSRIFTNLKQPTQISKETNKGKSFSLSLFP